ncbi:MAG: zinc ribbon domain-containing protein [bacterium]
MAEEIKQEVIAECKVTYFFGKMIAKAGTLSLRLDGLLFMPTKLDRALGSIDIPIPLDDIEGFHYDDTLQKRLELKTPGQTHRFIGSGLKELHEGLIVLKRNISSSNVLANIKDLSQTVSLTKCFNCAKDIKPNFKFCPYCRTQIKLICSKCKEEIEESWLSCAFCNTDFKKN